MAGQASVRLLSNTNVSMWQIGQNMGLFGTAGDNKDDIKIAHSKVMRQFMLANEGILLAEYSATWVEDMRRLSSWAFAKVEYLWFEL